MEIEERNNLEDTLKEEKARLEGLTKGIDDTTFATNEVGLGGELTVIDNHPADYGTLTHGRELDLTIRRMLQGREDELNKALEKIRDGTYGVCENCGRAIDPERLRVRPDATLCIQCQRLKDKSVS